VSSSVIDAMVGISMLSTDLIVGASVSFVFFVLEVV